MSEALLRLEAFLHEQIPLSRAMGVSVRSYDADGLVIDAPLGPNHNHLGTAFGGSLSAIATLTGYALLWMELGETNAHIVIKSSTIRYLRPVRTGICAVCRRLDAETLAHLKETYTRRGKAQVDLQVRVMEDQQVCVEFEGLFVVMR